MQRKTERLGLILTPAEKAAVVRMAESDGGLSRAAMIRRLIRAEAERRGIWPISRSCDQTGQGVAHA